jgi:starch synthase (maltosyl-transferring)
MTQPSISLPERVERVVIGQVLPQVDGGRHPVKRILGERLQIEAHVVIDGHDEVAVEAQVEAPSGWAERVRLEPVGNDVFRGSFPLSELGLWRFRVSAWADEMATWHALFKRRVEGGEGKAELLIELREAADLLAPRVARASGRDARRLKELHAALEAGDVETGLSSELLALAQRTDPGDEGATSGWRPVQALRELARFSAWYELFPRSAGRGGRHARLEDAAERLEYVKALGFDIVYLPPIHPIGRTHRKGRDNAPQATTGDPGSPWAIGAAEGGHEAVHPGLGGMRAFERFVARARELGLEVALDLALQASPDHPWVKEHPEWFRRRADGSIRYAENPPKKYQDVVAFDFATPAWRELWGAIEEVVEGWIARGVTVFRVDNPHTKPFAFWEWLITRTTRRHPELVYLAEAFTRPKVMQGLAKLGFTQSYTYFTWRTTKQELREYAEELARPEMRDFFQPSFWPNTPDILPEHLEHGNRATFTVRAVLASMLSTSWGVYGPVFELMVTEAHPDREEYARNEKYEIREWPWDPTDEATLAPLLARLNAVRRNNSALQHNDGLWFCEIDNPQLLAWARRHGDNVVLCVVNLDSHQAQEGEITLPLAELGLSPNVPFMLEEQLAGSHYFWQGARHALRLDPASAPALVFRVIRRLRREKDFDYYLG